MLPRVAIICLSLALGCLSLGLAGFRDRKIYKGKGEKGGQTLASISPGRHVFKASLSLSDIGLAQILLKLQEGSPVFSQYGLKMDPFYLELSYIRKARRQSSLRYSILTNTIFFIDNKMSEEAEPSDRKQWRSADKGHGEYRRYIIFIGKCCIYVGLAENENLNI